MTRARRKRILWSTAELKLLRDLAGRESARRIARGLERSLQCERCASGRNRISLALRCSRFVPLLLEGAVLCGSIEDPLFQADPIWAATVFVRRDPRQLQVSDDPG